MKRRALAAAIALFATGLTGLASAQSITLTVDCAKGQKIGDAIERADVNKPLTVNVRGTCTESVLISRDNVTIQGGTVVGPDSNTATISTTARLVRIVGMTLSGGSNGVWARRQTELSIVGTTIQNTASHAVRAVNAAVRIASLGNPSPRPCVIEHSGGSGVSAEMGASVNVSGCQIHDNAEAGIHAQSNSVVSVNSNTIGNNGAYGVLLEGSSQGYISGNTISGNGTNPAMRGNGVDVSSLSQASVVNGNIISDNRGDGVVASVGSSVGVDNNTITGNGGSGVVGYLGPVLVLHGNTISENGYAGVACMINCALQISGATIHRNGMHGIDINLGTKLWLLEPVTQSTDNTGLGLWCGDAESSVADLVNFSGSVSPDCTGY